MWLRKMERRRGDGGVDFVGGVEGLDVGRRGMQQDFFLGNSVHEIS